MEVSGEQMIDEYEQHILINIPRPIIICGLLKDYYSRNILYNYNGQRFLFLFFLSCFTRNIFYISCNIGRS